MKKINITLRRALSAILCMMFAFTLLWAGFITAKADSAADEGEIIITLGADLSDDERDTVYKLLNVSEDDIEKCKLLTITNEDEHNYLGEYLSSSVIGNRALSSIKLVKTADGSGINVTTNNINYCTEDMYINALATAGVADADVSVAGPFSISGTAALVGVMKAYEEMTGEEISEEVKDAATDELVTTGEISDIIGDSNKASELIGYIKNQVVSTDASSDEQIKDIVTAAADEMDISLSDKDVDNIVSTMKKISKLDLDTESLKEQAQGLYDKLENLDLNIDTEKAKGFFDKFLNFFKSIYDKIVNIFS